MLYEELYVAAASASWIPRTEKSMVYMYIQGIMNCYKNIDFSETEDASNYIKYNNQFLTTLSSTLPIHMSQLMVFDGYIKKLVSSDCSESESNVISISDMTKQTIITNITSMLTMLDMDSKSFLVNMDIGNKKIHLQIDTFL